MARVLIVDDEPSIVLAVRDELAFEGFDVDSTTDGVTALSRAREFRPDVLVLDLMLPGLNGFEVCRRLRAELPELWIIMLTARGQEADRVTGFETGADDYVTKPFSLREVVARVKVGLRRQRSQASRRTLSLGDIRVDVGARQVRQAGVEVPLTRTEFDILALLLERTGQVVTREEICDQVWNDVNVSYRVIDTHIHSLRKKLEAHPNHPKHLVSVRGVGYRLA